MKSRTDGAGRAAWALILSGAIGALSGCHSRQDKAAYPGYAEGEYVRVASTYGGNLAQLSVKRGDTVAAGAPLFSLEQENERAAREEAAARVAQGAAQLANVRKARRPEEIAAVQAQLAQAEAALKQSSAALARTEALVTQGFVSTAQLDDGRTAQERDRARVAELRAQVRVAQLASRPDEIVAAEAALKASREQLAQAQWRVEQKSLRAPRAGLVSDTLYTAGDWVQPGAPVVTLLPPENIKLKFFVPERQVGALQIGRNVTVRCDGCAPLTARISFISPQAEYTAPLIYSKENRASLVFLVEARPAPADAVRLHPGQPVEIEP